MKKIVIIGANDFQNQLILKAKEMGFETHVFAWQDGSIGERLYLSKIYLSTAELFAWTLTIILISTLFEKLILFLWKKAAGYGIQIQEEIHVK